MRRPEPFPPADLPGAIRRAVKDAGRRRAPAYILPAAGGLVVTGRRPGPRRSHWRADPTGALHAHLGTKHTRTYLYRPA
jgi:hypothetical protein